MSDESAEDRREFGLALGDVRYEPQSGGSRLRWYVAAVGLFPFALIVFSFYWMSTGEYIHHSRSLYLSQLGYGAKLRGADCDVVIDGDSTAMVDLMPKVIAARTGLSACNIAEVAGVKRVNGMAVLTTYLQHNHAPKYLVFQFAPEDLSDPWRWQWGGTFEGVLYGMQFGHKADVMRTLWRYPDSSLGNAELGFRSGLVWHLTKSPPAEEMHSRDTQLGRMPEGGEPLTKCDATDDRKLAPQPDWLAKLRQTYGKDGTRVLIDVVPQPTCDPTVGYYAGALAGLIDNKVSTLPPEMFIGTGRLHMNDAGATVVSERVAAQILQAEKGGR